MDGLIYASSMVMLDSAGREVPFPALTRWLLGLVMAATLAANVAHGLGHGPVGAAVAAWSAVALAGWYELFMTIIRGPRQPEDLGRCARIWTHSLTGRSSQLRQPVCLVSLALSGHGPAGLRLTRQTLPITPGNGASHAAHNPTFAPVLTQAFPIGQVASESTALKVVHLSLCKLAGDGDQLPR